MNAGRARRTAPSTSSGQTPRATTRIEPPIHAVYLRSGGAMTLIFIVDGRERGQLLLHAVGDAGEHRRAAREHDVAVEVLAVLDVALHDRIVDHLVDAGRLHAAKRRLEEELGAAEALVADGDHLAVGQLVRLLERRRRRGRLHLLLKVERDVRHLLLDVAHDLALGGGGERVAALGENLHHVVGEVAAGDVEAQRGVRQREAVDDRHAPRDAVANLEHDAGGAARGVERAQRLRRDGHRRRVERLEHDLRHLLQIGLGRERAREQQHRVLLGRDAQLVVERVVPDLLHVVPVGDDAVLDRVLERENAALRLRLVADVRVLLAHADHHASVARAADNRRKHGARRIVARKPALHMPDDMSNTIACCESPMKTELGSSESGV
jgi:hypothetical protein